MWSLAAPGGAERLSKAFRSQRTRIHLHQRAVSAHSKIACYALGQRVRVGYRGAIVQSAAVVATIMGKRYGHIEDTARRSAVQVLESAGKSRGTGHRIWHNVASAENAGQVTH